MANWNGDLKRRGTTTSTSSRDEREEEMEVADASVAYIHAGEARVVSWSRMGSCRALSHQATHVSVSMGITEEAVYTYSLSAVLGKGPRAPHFLFFLGGGVGIYTCPVICLFMDTLKKISLFLECIDFESLDS